MSKQLKLSDCSS